MPRQVDFTRRPLLDLVTGIFDGDGANILVSDLARLIGEVMQIVLPDGQSGLLGDVLSEIKIAAASGLPGAQDYNELLSMTASSPPGRLVEVTNDPGDDGSGNINGVYLRDNDPDAPNGWRKTADRTAKLRSDMNTGLDGAESGVATIRGGVAGEPVLYLHRSTTDLRAPSLGQANFVFGFEGGLDIPAGSPVDSLVVDMLVPTGTASLRLRLWWRPSSHPQVDAAQPGTVGVDTQLGRTAYIDPLSVGLPVGAGRYTRVILPFPLFRSAAGRVYLFETDALDASGNRLSMGFGYITSQPQRPVHRRGYYRPTVDTGFLVALEDLFYFAAMPALAKPASPIAEQQTRATLAGAFGDLAAGFSSSTAIVATRPQIVFFPASFGHGGVAWAIDVGPVLSAGAETRRLAMPLEVGADVATMRLTARRRQTAAANVDLWPGQPGDITVALVELTPAQLGLVAGQVGIGRFPLPQPFDWAAGTTVWFELEALNAAGDRVAFGYGNGGPSFPALSNRRRGMFRAHPADPLTTVDANTSIAWSLERDRYMPAAMPAVQDLQSSFSRQVVQLGGRSHAKDIDPSFGFGGIAVAADVGVDIAIGSAPRRFVCWLSLDAGSAAAGIRLFSWIRSTASPNIDVGPGIDGDVLLGGVALNLADVGLAPGMSFRCAVDLPWDTPTVAGTSIFFSVEAVDSAGSLVAIGFGAGQDVAGALPAHRRGFFRGAASGGQAIWLGFNSPGTLAWGLERDQYADPSVEQGLPMFERVELTQPAESPQAD